MSSHIILSRTPFRITLGGGSTDMPPYYKQYGGFVFGVAINLYMDILIKQTRSDDLIHVHYKSFEAVPTVDEVKHEIAREALRMIKIEKAVAISFKSDTPAGTGLGSSGACAVGLLNGLALHAGNPITNCDAAEMAFELTQCLGLPDGKKDPYMCALGGFVTLEIDTTGEVKVFKPRITLETSNKFWDQSLFYYTGICRDSKSILAAQDAEHVLKLKHKTKEVGFKMYQSFIKGDLDTFGSLLDEHWRIKKEMVGDISNPRFDEIYATAKKAGALGGNIMGAGGGGYFMFYCPSQTTKDSVRQALQKYNMREMRFDIDEIGSRTKIIDL